MNIGGGPGEAPPRFLENEGAWATLDNMMENLTPGVRIEVNQNDSRFCDYSHFLLQKSLGFDT